MSKVQAELPALSATRDLNEINKRLLQLRNSNCHLVGPGVQSLVKLETLPTDYEINWHAFLFSPDPKGPHFYHDKRWGDGEVALRREPLLEMWVSAGGGTLHTQRDDDGRL